MISLSARPIRPAARLVATCDAPSSLADRLSYCPLAALTELRPPKDPAMSCRAPGSGAGESIKLIDQ
jgi:hypothetical protein